MVTPTPFEDLAGFRAQLSALPAPDASAKAAAAARNEQLTKPPGALGRLEELAIWYAAWRGTDRPSIDAAQVIVFAGNHGVTAQGVSAFPSDVTEQMVLNFQAGGAAINHLAGAVGARLDVVPIALDQPTADFTKAPAMGDDELLEALQIGWSAVDPKTDLLVTGEMGIGNTTAAAAMSAALFGGAPEHWTGRGTGVDDAGLDRKTDAVRQALALHHAHLHDPLEVLRRLGGREIGAMTGAIAAARAHRIPVLLDGYICTAAASVLYRLTPDALAHVQAGHVSAETAHPALLDALSLVPILSLDLRLGEASGGALAISILKSAVACHSGMATFGEAGVSEG